MNDGGADGAPALDGGGTGDGGFNGSDTAAGMQLAWLLALMNGPPTAITADAVAPHFSASFLQQVPAAPLAMTLAGIAASDAPITLVQILSSTPGSSFGANASPSTISAVAETARHLFYRISLAATPGGTAPNINPVVGLLFQPAPEYDMDLRDPATLDQRLATVAPDARLYIGRVTAGACTATHTIGADQPMPLGSLFKIYVLGALAADIAAGTRQWTDMVTIQDQYKSLPSGMLQDQPAGTMLSVQDVASDMISISDNTAADHLLRLVGRERVESYQTVMGHAMPALNIPFPTTRELFILKIGATADERAAYIAAGAGDRRNLLDNVYDARALPDLATALAFADGPPLDIEQIEWFATPADICRAFAALEVASEMPSGAPIAKILSINPGAPIDTTTFSYVGFKGGSEPGVLTLGWLLRRASDNVWTVVTLGFADTTKAIDENLAAYYALAALDEAGR
jgi:beta-lactamase class A